MGLCPTPRQSGAPALYSPEWGQPTRLDRGRASPAPVAAATYPSVIIKAYKNSRLDCYGSAVFYVMRRNCPAQ
ncbi:MAG: hypothetical protein J6O50_09505, partial [Ruminiclostridium sp.]|nr:hypothetical protein [Ruminiclostridium sp.]